MPAVFPSLSLLDIYRVSEQMWSIKIDLYRSLLFTTGELHPFLWYVIVFYVHKIDEINKWQRKLGLFSLYNVLEFIVTDDLWSSYRIKSESFVVAYVIDHSRKLLMVLTAAKTTAFTITSIFVSTLVADLAVPGKVITKEGRILILKFFLVPSIETCV